MHCAFCAKACEMNARVHSAVPCVVIVLRLQIELDPYEEFCFSVVTFSILCSDPACLVSICKTATG